MTREELIEMLNILFDNAEIGCADITVIKHVSFDSFKFVLVQVIKALEQEPCEDAISRQAVCDLTFEEPSYTDALNVLTEIRDKVKALPSVIPAERTGHWEKNGKSFICSECGDFALKVETGCLVNRHLETYLSSYCPNCGAKMVEPQESEDKE